MHARIIVLTAGLMTVPLVWLTAPGGDAVANPAWPVADTRTENTVNGHVLTDAPVPSVEPPGLSPADRVAGSGSRTLDAGPVNSTPFSSTPTGTLSSGGTQISNADRVTAPSDGSGVTPNLGK